MLISLARTTGLIRAVLRLVVTLGDRKFFATLDKVGYNQANAVDMQFFQHKMLHSCSGEFGIGHSLECCAAFMENGNLCCIQGLERSLFFTDGKRAWAQALSLMSVRAEHVPVAPPRSTS